jgi:hypothetical protein
MSEDNASLNETLLEVAINKSINEAFKERERLSIMEQQRRYCMFLGCGSESSSNMWGEDNSEDDEYNTGNSSGSKPGKEPEMEEQRMCEEMSLTSTEREASWIMTQLPGPSP